MEMFRGDFTQLERFIKRSWAENTQEPLEYDEAFLRDQLQAPGMSFELCPAIYDGNELVAFGAGFPRTIRMDGVVRRFLLDSFITIAPEHKGRGLGGVIWNAIADSGKRNDYDGLITFCVEGDRMNQSMPKFSQQYSLPTAQVFTVSYLARPVTKKGSGLIQSADPQVLVSAAESLAAVPLCRMRSDSEAEWQCRRRVGAFGACKDRATIAGYRIATAGVRPAVCGIVDDVLWGDLDDAKRFELVQQLLDVASGQGIELLLTPQLGYADMSPFTRAGFRKTRRTLHMYLTSWNRDVRLGELSSAYIDVF